MMDELDSLRKPGESVVWRETPVWSWRWILLHILMLVVAVIINSLVNNVEWQYSAIILFAGIVVIFLMSMTEGRPRTLITEERVLRLGRRRGFWGDRQDPAYAASLTEVSSVSLTDTGSYLSVEVRHADSGRVDVLTSDQPQALAAAIAEAAGLGETPLVGRLEHVAHLCNLFGMMMAWIAWHWIGGTPTGPLDLGPLHEFPALAITSFVLLFAMVLGLLLAAVVAVLFMPLYATAEEAGNWFSLRPSRRLIRWLGWKSRPYAWLARLVYGNDLKMSAERST